MSAIEAADLPRPEHPRLSAFERDPHREFDRIMRGIADVHPYERAEPGDILWVLFGRLASEDPLRAALDSTVLAWLEQRRAEPPELRLAFGLHRYVGRVADALSFVGRLDLPGTARRLGDEHQAWLEWAEPMVLGGAHDSRNRLWLALAQRQETNRFDWLWYSICHRVGRRDLPERYLSIGLLGLRRLPHEERQQHQAMLGGLALWARHLREGEADRNRFRDQWLALDWQYPRGPEYWRELVAPLLEQHQYRGKPFVEWWRDMLFARGIRLAAH